MHDDQPSSAGSLDRRKVVLGLSLAALSGIAQARLPKPNKPRIKEAAFRDLIPKKIGDFTFNTESGLVLPPPDALSARLYDSIVTRTYTGPDGQMVMLLIAYNNKQDGVLQLHRPEICYPAGGYKLTSVDPIDVPMGDGKVLPSQIFGAFSEQRNEIVLYWSRVGDEFPRKWLDQRLAVAEANLQGIVPDGILVRVSTIASDVAEAAPALLAFTRALRDASGAKGRELLFGNV